MLEWQWCDINNTQTLTELVASTQPSQTWFDLIDSNVNGSFSDLSFSSDIVSCIHFLSALYCSYRQHFHYNYSQSKRNWLIECIGISAFRHFGSGNNSNCPALQPTLEQWWSICIANLLLSACLLSCLVSLDGQLKFWSRLISLTFSFLLLIRFVNVFFD